MLMSCRFQFWLLQEHHALLVPKESLCVEYPSVVESWLASIHCPSFQWWEDRQRIASLCSFPAKEKSRSIEYKSDMLSRGMATTYRVCSLDLDRFQFLLFLKRLVLASVLTRLLLLDLGHGEVWWWWWKVKAGRRKKKKIISGTKWKTGWISRADDGCMDDNSPSPTLKSIDIYIYLITNA